MWRDDEQFAPVSVGFVLIPRSNHPSTHGGAVTLSQEDKSGGVLTLCFHSALSGVYFHIIFRFEFVHSFYRIELGLFSSSVSVGAWVSTVHTYTDYQILFKKRYNANCRKVFERPSCGLRRSDLLASVKLGSISEMTL